MTQDRVFTQQIKLPYSAMGASGQIKLHWILNMFQDAAAQHCDQFGISGFDMAKAGLKWVVSRYQIFLHQNPFWLQPMELKTWRTPWKNLYELRQFSLVNQDQEEMATALGIWILVKSQNSKPVRLSPHLPSFLMTPLAQGPDQGPKLLKNDHELLEFDHESEFQIRAHDLDLNQHVNNTVYIQWALESLPAEFHFDYFPQECRVSFLKESFYPGRILSRVKIESDPIESDQYRLMTQHSILHKSDMARLANLTLFWGKNQDGERGS